MAKLNDHADDAAFLRGGGETGSLIANYDWALTPLGPLSAWRPSLKNMTAVFLRSSAPIALLWGKDSVTIYNDAYAVLLGERHPRTLGSKARETSPLADLTDLAIEIGMAGGARTFRDFELTFFRSGRPEPVRLNIDVSPVPDENGLTAGVLIIGVETSKRMLIKRKTPLELERLRRLFKEAPGFMCLLSGPQHVVEFVNDAHKRLFGDRHAVGKPFREAFPDIADQGFPYIDRVRASGERFIARAAPVLVSRRTGWAQEEHLLDFVLEPVTGDDGKAIGVFVEGFDVTEQIRAQAAAEESSRRLSAAMAVARLGAFELDQETGTATLNDRAREIYGFGPNERLTIADLTRRIAPAISRASRRKPRPSTPAGAGCTNSNGESTCLMAPSTTSPV